jgi:hypothetical protein
MFKRLFLFVVCLMVLVQSDLWAQKGIFQAQVSAQKIGLKEYFQITYSIINAPNASQFTPPSFVGFNVLDGPTQSSSAHQSNINGRVESSTTTSISYVLSPKKIGKLSIDPATVVIDGATVRSNATTIEVVKESVMTATQRQQIQQQTWDPFAGRGFSDWVDPSQKQKSEKERLAEIRAMEQKIKDLDEAHLSRNVLLKVVVNNQNPYFGQLIIADYKLYRRIDIYDAVITQRPSLNGFWSEEYNLPPSTQLPNETVNGLLYNVYLLKRTALFPQQLGDLVLDPIKVEGNAQVITGIANPNAVVSIDPFMGQANYNYLTKIVPISLTSAPVTINVKPLPEQGKPVYFSGAVGAFAIQTDLTVPQISTNDEAKLKVIIRGVGNSKLISAPLIDIPDGLKLSEPQVKDTFIRNQDQIEGGRVFIYNITADSSGQYVIPAIDFSYFDADQQKYITTTTQPLELSVTPGVEGKGSKKLIFHNIDNRELKASYTPFSWVQSLGYWLVYIIVLVVLVVVGWSKKRNSPNRNLYSSGKEREQAANAQAWARLNHAKQLLIGKDTKAFYEEVSKALWLYLSDKLHIPIAQLSKGNIGAALQNKAIPATLIQEVMDILSRCEVALYTPMEQPHQKDELLQSTVTTISALEKAINIH